MRGLVTVGAVLLVAALAHADAPAPAPLSVDRIDAAAKATLDSDYQPQLPRYDDGNAAQDGNAGPRMRPDRRGNGRVDGRDRGELIDTRERERQGESGFMQIVMWGMLIVLAVLFAVWITTELAREDADPELPASESQIRMQAAVDAILEKPLGDADELAAKGAYAEAIHTLLLRTLQELVKSAAVRVAPAMTSREILARVPLLADARTALTGLITAVEITHFGDEPANAADYQRCREQFNVFAAALRASRPGAAQEAAAA